MPEDIYTNVIEVTAKNVQRISYIVYRPGDRTVTEITGNNGVGKTTALQLIDMLADTKCVPEMPIKQGEKEGEITAQVKATIDGKSFDVFISRKFSEKNPRGKVLIQPSTVGPYKTAAQIAEALFGNKRVVATPHGFTKQTVQEQIRLLTAAVATDTKLSEIEDIVRSSGAENFIIGGDTPYDQLQSAKEIVAENRKIAKREVLRLTPIIESLPLQKVEPVSVTVLQAEQTAADAAIKAREKLTADLQRFVSERDRLLDEQKKILSQIEGLQQQVASLDTRIEKAGVVITEQQAKVDAPDPVQHRTIDAIMADIAASTDRNRKAGEFAQRIELETEKKAEEAKRIACDNALDALKDYQQMAIDVSKLGIEGLEIIDETDENGKKVRFGVYVDGIPVAQLGAAASAIMNIRIQCAMNPSLKCVFIDEWDAYDAKSKQEVDALAASLGLSVIVTRVAAEGERAGVEIMDDGYAVDHYAEIVK